MPTTRAPKIPADLAPSAAHVIATYRQATPSQVAEGLAWYADAHSLARALDPADVARGAAVIAVLSPQVNWERNVTLAVRAYADGQGSGCVGAVKATRILAGEDWRTVIGGDKVTNFARVIADPTNPTAVVIDRHAFDVAVGRVTNDDARKILSRRGVYEIFADAYREAARVLGVSPAQVQAVTWTVWRDAKITKSLRGHAAADHA